MPLKSQLHVDQLLSNLSVKYQNAEYIWDKVFPKVNVKKDSDKYRIYARNFRVPETARADKAASREHDFQVSTSSYLLEKHSLKDYVSDSQQENYDISDLRADTVEELTGVIHRRIEKSVADLFTTTSWSLNVSLAAANAFSANTTVSNPIPVFDTGATEIIQASGYAPNFGILPRKGMISCKNHISILDRIKYTSAEVTPVMLAALFGLPELLVPTAQIDTSQEGLTETITDMWAPAFLGWKAASPGPMKPSCGYTFWKSAPSVKRWRDEERSSEAIEVNVEYQPKVVASLTGFLINGI